MSDAVHRSEIFPLMSVQGHSRRSGGQQGFETCPLSSNSDRRGDALQRTDEVCPKPTLMHCSKNRMHG